MNSVQDLFILIEVYSVKNSKSHLLGCCSQGQGRNIGSSDSGKWLGFHASYHRHCQPVSNGSSFKMWTSQGDDIDQKHTIKLNPIFEKIGYFGKFQILQLALVWTTLILGSCASFKSYAFTGYMPKYRCLVPQCEDIKTATNYSKVCKPKYSFITGLKQVKTRFYNEF